MKIKLVQTCFACPEQYDAYYEGRVVGYLRLRWGHFSVECGDEEVYCAEIGDGWTGTFTCDGERERHFREAKKAIKKWLRKQ